VKPDSTGNTAGSTAKLTETGTVPITDPSEETAVPLRLVRGQRLLEERLTIVEELGHGGMGVVYRAEDNLLRRNVAVKTLSRADAGHLYQLKREFRTLAGFSHPNLVQLYELHVVDGVWLVIMELVEGMRLDEWLKRKPSRERILKVFRGLLEALRVLHDGGHIHRDVKPSNVMVASEDRAVLLDFGLAAPILSKLPTLPAGTLAYMAPEVLWSNAPAQPADWYSFGVALFQALTGLLPYKEEELFHRKRHGPAAAPKEFVPGIPDVLDEAVRKLLDPNPANRPAADELANILGGPASPRLVPVLPRSPFVARNEALGRLHESLEAVRKGQTRIALVSGPSGMGKTALVRHFLEQVEERGDTLVLTGRCHPQESVPYKALDDLVDNLVRYLLSLEHHAVVALAPRYAGALLRLFPVMGRVSGVRQWYIEETDTTPSEIRRRGSDALRTLVGKLADQQPVVLWIDDVQWSDEDSGPVLKDLLSPPDAPRLLLILSSRDSATSMSNLYTEPAPGAASKIELEPLTRSEIVELAHATAPALGTDRLSDLESIARESDGSPFFLGEWIRRRRELDFSGHRERIPTSISDLIQVRLGRLSPESRRLVDVIAIAGRPLDVDLALDAAGLGGAGRQLTYALCADSLLRVSVHHAREYLETYHDRIREFTVGSLDTSGQQVLHRGLADSIRRSRTPDSAALVEHYLAAGDREEAALFVLIAAEEAEQGLALDQAADMYERALLLREDVRHDKRFLERRANALANAARRDDAARAYEEAAGNIAGEENSRNERTILRGQAAEQYFCAGDLGNGLRALNMVLEDVGVHVPARPLARTVSGQGRRARFMLRGYNVAPASRSTDPRAATRLDALWRATRGVVMLDHTLADALAGRHLLESLHEGDASRALRAIGLESAFEANIGGTLFWKRSHKLLDEVQRLAAMTGDAYDAAWLAHCRASCAWFEGRWRDSVELGSKAIELLQSEQLHAERSGIAWDLAVQHGFILSALAHLGRLRELSRNVLKLIADAKRRKDNYSLRVFQTGDAVLHWLAGNDYASAIDLAEKTLEGVPGNQFTSQHRHHLVAVVQSHLYSGDAPQAWSRIESAWGPLRWAGFLSLNCLGTQLRYLRASSALALAKAEGPRSRAFKSLVGLASHEAKRIRRSTLPMAAPMAASIEAGVAGATNHHKEQIAAFLSAVDGFGVADMALHREAARLSVADLIQDSEDLRKQSVEWMTNESVVNPISMAQAVVPRAWPQL